MGQCIMDGLVYHLQIQPLNLVNIAQVNKERVMELKHHISSTEEYRYERENMTEIEKLQVENQKLRKIIEDTATVLGSYFPGIVDAYYIESCSGRCSLADTAQWLQDWYKVASENHKNVLTENKRLRKTLDAMIIKDATIDPKCTDAEVTVIVGRSIINSLQAENKFLKARVKVWREEVDRLREALDNTIRYLMDLNVTYDEVEWDDTDTPDGEDTREGWEWFVR